MATGCTRHLVTILFSDWACRLSRNLSANEITEPACYRTIESEHHEDYEQGLPLVVHSATRERMGVGGRWCLLLMSFPHEKS